MSDKSRGFTLVEILIISPIVILFIGSFIALLVTLTGDSLIVRERNIAVYDTQNALDAMQTDVANSIGFLSSTDPLTTPAPQGKDNSTNAAFTDVTSGQPDTLIVKLATTTKGPNDPTRELIYQGSGDCNTSNPIYSYVVVYFVADDPDTTDTTDKALYKRKILPTVASCDIPWQSGSCKKEVVNTNTTVCQERDEKLVSGISTLDVKYFSPSDQTTGSDSGATTATNASVSLTVDKQVAGSDITYNSTTRTESANLQSADATAITPTNSPIQLSTNFLEPYKTNVTWDRIGNATGYTAKYQLGGGTVQSVNISQPAAGVSPTFAINAAYRKQSIQITELKVITNGGTINYGTLPAATSVPKWNDCTMPNNGWQNYPGTTYNTMGFTKTSTGVVGLKGLVTGGPIGTGAAQTVCTLPVGFRPTEHIIVQQPATDGVAYDRAARVDVYPDGRVNVTITPLGSSGTSNWVSMDGLMFVTSTSNPSWVNGSYYNSWYFYNYNDGYGQIKFFKDSLGRTWVQGIATGGVQGNVISYLPVGYAPDGGMHYPMYSDSTPNAVNFYANSSDRSMRSRTSGSYIGTNAVFYASTGGKYALPLYNGWYNYNNGWTTAQCYKGADDIVILQGLVAGGNPSAGGLTNIGGCAGGGIARMSTGRNAILGGVAYPGGAGIDAAYRIDLAQDDYMYPYGGGASSGWTSLDGVHYIAD